MNNIPPPVTCEDEQAFLDRHFETLQHVSEMPNRKGTGAQSTTRPSVVGPLGVSSNAIDLMRSSDDRRKDASDTLAKVNIFPDTSGIRHIYSRY